MAEESLSLQGARFVYDTGYFEVTPTGAIRLRAAGLSDIIKHRIYNDSGAPTAIGTLLYVKTVNVDGQSQNVGLADSTGGTVRAAVLIADEIIAAGAFGNAVSIRVLTGVNTSAGANGDPVFLSATAGGWSLTAPTGAAPVEPQVVGYVMLAAVAGSIRFMLPESSLPQHTHQDAARGGQIPTAGVVDGIFSADAAGRLKMADNFFLDNAAILGKFGRGIQRDIGHAAVGYFRADGAITAGAFVTIDGRTYEWTDGGPGTHDVAIIPGGAGPWAANVAMAALTAGLNADAGRSMNGANWPASNAFSAGTSLVGIVANAAAIALAVSGANLYRSAATSTGQSAVQSRQQWGSTHIVTAENAAAWLLHAAGHGGAVPVGSLTDAACAPRHLIFQVRDVNGYQRLTNTIGTVFRQAGAGYFVLEVTDDVGVMADTDVISWSAWAA